MKKYYINATACLTVIIPDDKDIAQVLEKMKYSFSSDTECKILTDGAVELEYLDEPY